MRSPAGRTFDMLGQCLNQLSLLAHDKRWDDIDREDIAAMCEDLRDIRDDLKEMFKEKKQLEEEQLNERRRLERRERQMAAKQPSGPFAMLLETSPNAD